MIKFLVKCFFLTIPLLIIMFISFMVFSSVATGISDDLLAFIVGVIVVLGVSCWIFSAIIDKIAASMSFMYWLICFALCVIVLVFGLKDLYGLPLQTELFAEGVLIGVDQDSWNFFCNNTVLAWQATLGMFLIPSIDGNWTTYRNTEVTVYSNGFVKVHSWLSRTYTPGVFSKLGLILVLTVVTWILYSIHHALAWVSFLAEGGYSLWLTIGNAKLFFEK